MIIEGETIDTIVPEDTLDVENYSPSLGKNMLKLKLLKVDIVYY